MKTSAICSRGASPDCRSEAAVVQLENVPGFASSRFDDYRRKFLQNLGRLGYEAECRGLNASWFGVPQLPSAIRPGSFSRQVS